MAKHDGILSVALVMRMLENYVGTIPVWLSFAMVAVCTNIFSAVLEKYLGLQQEKNEGRV